MKISDVKTLNIELSTRCTARCPLCARVQMNYTEKVDIPLDTLKKIPFENVSGVSLSGSLGEPTCYPQFTELVDYIRDVNNDMMIKLTTNGYSHDEQFWYDLGKHFSRECQGHAIFGIDGLEDTHSLYRVGTDFNNIVKNVKAFSEGGGRSYLQMILFKHNEHQLQDVRQLSQELGCMRMFYRPSKEYNDTYERPNVIPVRTQGDVVSEGGPLHCFILERKELFLNVDGYLMPCYLLSRRRHHYKEENQEFLNRYNECFEELNLNKYDFEDIVQHEFYDYVLENIENLVTCNDVCRCTMEDLVNWV